MENEAKTEKTSTSGEVTPASSREIALNDSGTSKQSGTRLTQWRSPPVPESKVYFIQCDKAVKIGVSTNPKQRFGELQVGSPYELILLGVINGTKETEQELHAKFDHLHLRGEWFKAHHELLDYVYYATLPEPVAEPEPLPVPPPPRAVAPPRPSPPLSAEAANMIRDLTNLRFAHGATTPIGYGCSNIIEQIKAMTTYVRPEWATHECQTLPWMMAKQIKRIEALKAGSYQ